ncbi:hypothetical protein U2057_15425, partial [Listeria monocytogenes]|uniref:hypothetical protein n=1 Tax=Listeria monocytogenes TaxID=1639 RepID=UPI002FDC0F2A
GFLVGVIFRKKFFFTAFGGGIGGGIALNKCADEFNRIQAREIRVAESLTTNRESFPVRLNNLRSQYFK